MVTTNSLTKVEIKSDQGLTEKQQHGVLSVLKTLLADECRLYTNMIGVNLYPLDATFEDHLNEIDDVMDKVAGYMRRYSAKGPGTMDEFLTKAHLNEALSASPEARMMVTNLVTDHRTIICFLREHINEFDEVSEDANAVDLMIALFQRHQKMVKTLRMYLEA